MWRVWVPKVPDRSVYKAKAIESISVLLFDVTMKNQFIITVLYSIGVRLFRAING
jgi:hypothetical protein